MKTEHYRLALVFILSVFLNPANSKQEAGTEILRNQRNIDDQIPLFRTETIRVIVWENDDPRLAAFVSTIPNLCKYDLLLNEAEIVKELEPSESQSDRLALLMDRILLNKNRLQARSLLADDYKEEVEILKLKKLVEKELAEILLPFQFQRLGEIENRLIIRNLGIGKFLLLKSKNFGIDLSESEKRNIQDVVGKFASDFETQSKVEMEISLENLKKPLTVTQREEFERLHQSQSLSKDLDIYLAQLRYLNEQEEFLDIGEFDSRHFENLMEFAPEFQISFDGRFRAVKPGVDQIRIPSFIQRVAQSDENALEFSALQKSEISQGFESYWKEVKQHQSVQSEQIQSTGVESETENKLFNEKMHASAEKLNKKCLNILNPAQSQIVRSLHSRELLIRYGVVANLIFGDLGRALKVDKEQNKKLREACYSETERLEQNLLKLDREIVEAVKKKLLPTNRDKFETAVGKELKNVIPTYRMLFSYK